MDSFESNQRCICCNKGANGNREGSYDLPGSRLRVHRCIFVCSVGNSFRSPFVTGCYIKKAWMIAAKMMRSTGTLRHPEPSFLRMSENKLPDKGLSSSHLSANDCLSYVGFAAIDWILVDKRIASCEVPLVQ